MDVQVVVVPCDEEQAPYLKYIESYDYKAGQAIVGGLIQPVTVERAGCEIWANEEGLLLGLPPNRRATTYLYVYAPEHQGFTVLVGDVYITGLPDEDGDTTSAPIEVISQFVG